MKNISYFQFLLFIVSILSIFILLLDITVISNPEISNIIQVTDLIICLIFFFDFIYNIITAENKLKYLKWGWLDLISSIPMIDCFRMARLARIFKLIKIIRLIKFSKLLYTYIQQHKTRNVIAFVCFIFILLIFTGSVGILIAEEGHAKANILLAEDAVWWSIVTITTIGYGDFYPVTTMGRIVSVFLMVGGISLFGIFTGSIASWFIKE